MGEDWQVPVLLGEYGVDPELPEAVDYMGQHYPALDSAGMHATWWQYSVSWDAWNEETLELVDGDGEDRPGVVDLLARPVPRAIAGTDAVYSFAEGRLDLRYTPDEGVTEVTLPTRIGPDWPGASAATITGTGACVDVREDRVYIRANEGATDVHVWNGAP